MLELLLKFHLPWMLAGVYWTVDIVQLPIKSEVVHENIVKMKEPNFMVCLDKIQSDNVYQVMIRYNADLVNCHITKLTDKEIWIETENPVFAPTPGQVCTIYDGENILVGGFIYLD